MKSFQFPLERVLSWRQTQQTMAEAALARLLGEQRSLQQARLDLQSGRATEQATVARASFSPGAVVERLDLVRTWTHSEDRRLGLRLHELEKAVQNQKRAVADATRNVKMLERLRTRRQSEWKAELDHELELLTGEWAVAQWRRQHVERSSSSKRRLSFHHLSQTAHDTGHGLRLRMQLPRPPRRFPPPGPRWFA